MRSCALWWLFLGRSGLVRPISRLHPGLLKDSSVGGQKQRSVKGHQGGTHKDVAFAPRVKGSGISVPYMFFLFHREMCHSNVLINCVSLPPPQQYPQHLLRNICSRRVSVS